MKRLEETKWLKEADSQSLQQSLFNLEEAYNNFFSKRSAFPKFKTKRSKQSCRFPQRVSIDFKTRRIILPKLGSTHISIDRTFDGTIKSVTVSKDSSGKFFASVLVETGKPLPEKESYEINTTVGIDLGIKHFCTLSDGTKIENERFTKQFESKLSREQRRLSRRKKFSKNRNRQRIRVALIHEQIRNKRKDFLHKLSSKLISENQAVAVEDLNVEGMVKNRKLAKHIQDASWSEFIRQLRYKAEWYGKTVLQIGRFEPSSKMCSCGSVNRNLKLSDRTWVCTDCGVEHDRDILAAQNIKRFSLNNIIGKGFPELTPLETGCC